MTSQSLRNAFYRSFPGLKHSLAQLISSKLLGPSIDRLSSWITEVVEYNVIGGKCNRGWLLVESATALAAAGRIPQCSGDWDRICRLGWSMELFQASFLMLDDIMDGSSTRRGKPAYYVREDVGMRAINDSFFLQSMVPWVIEADWGHHPCYSRMLSCVHETVTATILGQHLDMTSGASGASGADSFATADEQLYKDIVRLKTAYYSFCLPLQLALLTDGQSEAALMNETKHLAEAIGELFQVQDDHLDCFGDPLTTGKLQTDIQERKLNWPLVKALAMEDKCPGLVAELKELFSRPTMTAADVDRVKCLYRLLSIPELYDQFCAEKLAECRNLCNSYPVISLRQILHSILDRLANRTK